MVLIILAIGFGHIIVKEIKMAEDIETKINKLKREKHCLEFDLTCNGIINYGPIMR